MKKFIVLLAFAGFGVTVAVAQPAQKNAVKETNTVQTDKKPDTKTEKTCCKKDEKQCCNKDKEKEAKKECSKENKKACCKKPEGTKEEEK